MTWERSGDRAERQPSASAVRRGEVSKVDPCGYRCKGRILLVVAGLAVGMTVVVMSMQGANAGERPPAAPSSATPSDVTRTVTVWTGPDDDDGRIPLPPDPEPDERGAGPDMSPGPPTDDFSFDEVEDVQEMP